MKRRGPNAAFLNLLLRRYAPHDSVRLNIAAYRRLTLRTQVILHHLRVISPNPIPAKTMNDASAARKLISSPSKAAPKTIAITGTLS